VGGICSHPLPKQSRPEGLRREFVNAPAQLKEPKSRPFASECAVCLLFELKICPAVSDTNHHDCPGRRLQPISEHRIPARRMIYRQRDLPDEVPFICSGWAASVVTLLDGRRQILAFLLPGDIVSAAPLFGVAGDCSVEAITEVQYRWYRGIELRAALMSNSALLEKASRLLVHRELRARQLAVDLGRRSAEERIARLILGLRERLAERGMARDHTIEFPLRQHHVADATGLTSVHVSKVLIDFRRRGLIEVSDRSLTILDPVEFQRIANMR